MPVSKSELYHFGIHGMRWGVRRFQNSDGTLTEAGRKRYSNYNEKNNATEKINTVLNDLKQIKYSEFTKLQSPGETERLKSGSCHDQVIYTLDKLKNLGVNAQARFMIEYDPKTNRGGTTHSYVYVPTSEGIVWIENAWGGHEGIHRYDSLQDIEREFVRARIDGEWGNTEEFGKIEFQDFNPDDHKYGESLDELVNRTLK